MRPEVLLIAMLQTVPFSIAACDQLWRQDLNLTFVRPNEYAVPGPSHEVSEATPGVPGLITLIAYPEKVIPWNRDYRGMRLLLVNRTNQDLSLMAVDRGVDRVLIRHLRAEALDELGRWRPIEAMRYGYCGAPRGYTLAPERYWELIGPRYTGSFKTKLRFSLGGIAVSNAFEGSINPEQFVPFKIELARVLPTLLASVSFLG